MPPTWTTSDSTDRTTIPPDIVEDRSDLLTTFWAVTTEDDLATTVVDVADDIADNMPSGDTGGGSGIPTVSLVLFASLSVVICGFALTALILRIGSRLKKSKMEALEKKRHQQRMSVNNMTKEEPKPQAHKKLTIRMHTGQGKKRKQSKTTTFALNGSACKGESDQKSSRKPSLKRSKTIEALIEIGAFSKDFALPEVDQDVIEEDIGMDPVKIEETVLGIDSVMDRQDMSRKRARPKLERKDAAYTNSAFDQTNPDEIHSVYSETISELDDQCTDSPKHDPDLVLTEEDRVNLPNFSGGECVMAVESLPKLDDDFSDGSVQAREHDSMLRCRRYSSASSVESDGSPLSARKPLKPQFLKAFDKNRNNSRDSGYVESVISQESIKKRKLGIVEPFHYRSFLEQTPSVYSPTKTTEHGYLHRCPTCRTPAAQKPFYIRYPNSSVVFNKVPTRVEPFRKCVSVPYPPPERHYPVHKNRSYDPSFALTDDRQRYHTRSHSVVCDGADYSYMTPNNFFRKRNSATQTEGAPLHRKSTVRWKKDGANYILTPMENNVIDHLGPIYLAPES